MMNDNDIRALMDKAMLREKAGYSRIDALRLNITYQRHKKDYSLDKFLEQVQKTQGIPLGKYKDYSAMLDQGRQVLHALQPHTDRDLVAEITPYQIEEDPELFPEQEQDTRKEQDLFEELGHVVHMARTLDAVSEKLDKLLEKFDQLLEIERLQNRSLQIMAGVGVGAAV